jgi:AcrR family transcriptional regulator
VRTAGELFWRQGYANTGVSEIMKRAGATSGSFYHFFPTKDDLLLSVLGAVRRRVEEEILGLAESASSDPVGRLSALAQAYRVQTVPDAVEFGLPIGALVNELGPDRDDARRQIGEIYEIVVRRVAAWFAGSNRRSAALVVAALEGAALLARASRSAEAVDVCAEQLTSYVDAVVGSESGTEEMPPPAAADKAAGDWKAW